MPVELNVNGERRNVDVAEDVPLLWVLRDHLGLRGTKYGCGVGLCGACTVHLDGRAARSCVVTVGAARGREVTTIEGLTGPLARRLRAAWIAEQVPQCGYCQPGFLMAAAARPADRAAAGAAAAPPPNLCRCGTYARVRRALQRAADADRAP